MGAGDLSDVARKDPALAKKRLMDAKDKAEAAAGKDSEKSKSETSPPRFAAGLKSDFGAAAKDGDRPAGGTESKVSDQEPRKFPLLCLPPVLGDIAKAISDSIRVPLELAGPIVLGIISGAIGNRAVLIQIPLISPIYQAVRCGQCRVPFNCIDLERKVIDYPASVMKKGAPHSQPIDPRFLPILREIVEHRRKLNKTTLAELPLLWGVEMREFLDELLDKDAGFSEISHHGLRTAWITRAALSQGKITETFAKRFVDHASTEIHEITSESVRPI